MFDFSSFLFVLADTNPEFSLHKNRENKRKVFLPSVSKSTVTKQKELYRKEKKPLFNINASLLGLV